MFPYYIIKQVLQVILEQYFSTESRATPCGSTRGPWNEITKSYSRTGATGRNKVRRGGS